MTRKTVICNYIPHKTPSKPNFNDWCDEYKNDIASLFSIFKENIEDRYPYSINDNDWKSDELFLKFCRLVYNNSSKHIYK